MDVVLTYHTKPRIRTECHQRWSRWSREGVSHQPIPGRRLHHCASRYYKAYNDKRCEVLTVTLLGLAGGLEYFAVPSSSLVRVAHNTRVFTRHQRNLNVVQGSLFRNRFITVVKSS